MIKLSVGETVPSKYKDLIEENSSGAKMLTGENLETIAYLDNVSNEENSCFEDGRLVVSLTIIDSIPFLVFQFASFSFDCTVYDMEDREDCENRLTLLLVDSSNGLLKGIRILGLKHDFIKELKRLTKLNAQKSTREIFETKALMIMSKYSTSEIASKASIIQDFANK